MDIVIVSLLFLLLVFIGVKEQRKNDKNVKKIPLRVNVNGIRGKSTATRLISSVLTEAGYKNIGKTTGTAPRFISGYDQREREIIRQPKGVSIAEQIGVIELAAKMKVDSLVCECMAVNPEYQLIYQNKMIQANIGIIVNVLEDHLDEMGPTLDQIALAFTSTIPYNGKLVISEGDYADYFKKVAKERNTEVFMADMSEIPDGFLQEFDYMVFPNNILIPLAFAKAVGIDKETALRGMLNANPDPGALMIDELKVDDKRTVFVNAFAANDPNSTLEIWNSIVNLGYADKYSEKPLIILNARPDRVDRTEQMVEDCIPHLDREVDLLVMGHVVAPALDAYDNGKLENVDQLYNMEAKKADVLMDKLYDLMDNRIVFFIGNIHGEGEELLEKIGDWYEEGARKPSISME